MAVQRSFFDEKKIRKIWKKKIFFNNLKSKKFKNRKFILNYVKFR
jgi:hypothetical protein